MTDQKRHSLHWIAMEFKKNGWHAEEGLLDALRNEELTARVKYPSGWPEIHPVPSEIWNELDRDEFLSVTPTRPTSRREDRDEFSLEGHNFFQYEHHRLAEVARAAASHDVANIPKTLQSEICQRLEISSIDKLDDWQRLMSIYIDMDEELREENFEDYRIFVLDDDWRSFKRKKELATDTQNLKGKSGAPENENWSIIFEALLYHICLEKQEDIRKLTASKTWDDVARKVRDFAKLNGDPSLLPKDDTIARRLKALTKKNG